MAKRRKRTSVTRSRSGSNEIVIVEPQQMQAAPAKRRRGRVGRALARGGASKKKTIMGAGLGGLAYGFVEKTFGESIPRLPVIGRSGTVALACYFFAGRNEILNDIGIAAAVIAGYSLAKDGAISGYDDDHGLAHEA